MNTEVESDGIKEKFGGLRIFPYGLFYRFCYKDSCDDYRNENVEALKFKNHDPNICKSQVVKYVEYN